MSRQPTHRPRAETTRTHSDSPVSEHDARIELEAARAELRALKDRLGRLEAVVGRLDDDDSSHCPSPTPPPSPARPSPYAKPRTSSRKRPSDAVSHPSRAKKPASHAKKPASRTKPSTGRGPKLLKANNGPRDAGQGWMPFGPNPDHVDSIANEIQCNRCKGKMHFVCAGLDASKTYRGIIPWDECPNCAAGGDVCPDRCVRPDCWRRRRRRIIDLDQLQDERVVKRIIGRRKVRSDPWSADDEYLVEWAEHDIDQATWEPPASFRTGDGPIGLVKDFIRDAEEEECDMDAAVVLLFDALAAWDPATGELWGDELCDELCDEEQSDGDEYGDEEQSDGDEYGDEFSDE